MVNPVILVHGIWASAASLEPLRVDLTRRGISCAVTFDLAPNDGSAPIPSLVPQLDVVVRTVLSMENARHADVIGFSMGALVARWWIQRGGGRHLTRRFISISGPHRGTHAARALRSPGARDMRPGSELLRDLANDQDPWGDVEVHCVYTPYDLAILPARSAVLEGAKTVWALPVKLHDWMISDRAVLDVVAGLLRAR